MSVQISRILHAGYIFKHKETEIAFDPIFENPFSRNCHAFPSIKFDLEQIQKLKFSAVFISHYHDDHCSFESLNLLDRSTPIYLYCIFDELFSLIRELGFVNVFSLTLNQAVTIHDFKITPRPALDEDVDSIFQIQVAGLNILNVVDSWIGPATMENLEQMKPWDLILWPFQTMREIEVLSPLRAAPASRELPPEWIEQLQILAPRNIVPSSCQFQMEQWSWYNQAFFPISYQQFEKEMKSNLPSAQAFRLNPGASIELDTQQITWKSSLSWIHLIGNQELDYNYNPNAKPQSTEEIASHFEALGVDENQMALDYCQKEMMERFRELDPPEGCYFDRTRIWRLSLFYSDGRSQSFFYRIRQNQIEPIDSSEEPVAWTTDVPISRLYGALKQGESLTSMYIRVNGETFDPDIEMQIRESDAMEDPLIRCLFTGVFAAYQKAQLHQIKCRNAKDGRTLK